MNIYITKEQFNSNDNFILFPIQSLKSLVDKVGDKLEINDYNAELDDFGIVKQTGNDTLDFIKVDINKQEYRKISIL